MAIKDTYPSRKFTNQELKVSSWINTHKVWFNRIVYGSLLFSNLIILSLLGWQLFKYVSTYTETEQAIRNIAIQKIDWPVVRIAIAPDTLIIDPVEFVDTGTTSDFLSKVTNTNDDRWATFEYRFLWQNGSSEWLSTFILPQKSKFISVLGLEGVSTGSIRVEVKNVYWQKLSALDRELLSVTRNELVVLSSAFTQNVNEGFGGSPISGAEFIIENRTPFDLQNIPFTVIIRSGSTLTALNRVVVNRLNSNANRIVRVRWFSLIGGGTVTVEPDINFLDPAVIAPLDDDEKPNATI